MKSAKELFFKRVTNEWKYQISTWRVAIDWTVALYFVVPIVIIIIKTYVDWLKAPPLWLQQLPFIQLASILFFFIITGNLRVFVEEADMLFLVQQKQWIRQLRIWGIAYSIVISFFSSFLLFIFLYPLLTLYYKMTLFSIISWYILFVILKTLTGINKQFASNYFSNWKLGLAKWFIYLLTAIYYRISLILLDNASLFFLLIFILVILLIFLLHHLIALENSFSKDVAREQTIKLRYVNAIMQTQNNGLRKSRIIQINKKPWIFRHSNMIYKERNAVNLLAEACLKSVMRNNTNIYPILQTILICILFALSIPVSLKWIGLVGFAFLLTRVVGNLWERTEHNDYIRMFSWKAEDCRKAAVKAAFLLFTVFFLPISFTLGMTAYSWPGVVLFIVLGEIIGYFAVNIILY